MKRLRRNLALVGALAAVAAFGSAAGSLPEESAAQAAPRPNFVTIMVDDQAMNSFRRRYMPRTFKRFDGGTRFRNGFAAPPLCCPARAGFQTGQYPHNHGVFNNTPGWATHRDPANTISSWLKEAGYRTGFVGKYLHGFEQTTPAPGYDAWWAVHGRARYFDYTVSVNGRLRHMGSQENDYSTTAMTRRAKRFITSSSGPQPFFLWLNYYAPHISREGDGRCGRSAPVAAPRDHGRFRDVELEPGVAFDEKDISDKPGRVGSQPRIDRDGRRRISRRFSCTVEALQEVDRGVRDVFQTLRDSGEIGQTVVVYISDNGYFFGEHRIRKGKLLPYEPALRVPIVGRFPPSTLGGVRAKRVVVKPFTNIDLAPTFLELAGASPCVAGSCRVMDGRSAVKELAGGDPSYPRDRAILIEAGPHCPIEGIRTAGQLYVEHFVPDGAGGCAQYARELYDLAGDPAQLDNVFAHSDGGELGEALADRLESLRNCSGIAGRDVTSEPCE